MPPPGIETAAPCFPACPSNFYSTFYDTMLQELKFCKEYIEKNKQTLLTDSFVIGEDHTNKIKHDIHSEYMHWVHRDRFNV